MLTINPQSTIQDRDPLLEEDTEKRYCRGGRSIIISRPTGQVFGVLVREQHHEWRMEEEVLPIHVVDFYTFT